MQQIRLILLFLILILFSVFFIFFPKKIISPKVENKINKTISKVEEIKEIIVPEPTKISSQGLPTKHLIKTSFVQQAPEKNWDQPWQDACEEAAILTVDYFYKNINPSTEQNKNDIQKMIDFETQKSWGESINVDKMVIIGKEYLGYKSEIINDPTIDQLKKYISQDTPVIVPANGKILFEENKYFKDGGPDYHNIVLVGYDDSKNQFIVNDVGTQHGKNFRYSYDLVMKSIHDFPESNKKEDINSGAKRILILLK